MEWPLADWLRRREAAFGRMRDVLTEQSEVLSQPDSPDFFERWAALGDRWTAERQEVEEVQRLIGNISAPRVLAETDETMKSGLRLLAALQQQVEDKLLLESNRQLREFQTANKQRLVLNSYHGGDHKEQVALYFDEKK